jgi:hypothetical protein
MATKHVFSLSLIAFIPSLALGNSCQELAGKFATHAAELTVTELASLRTCVSDALRSRLTTNNPPPPPADQTVPSRVLPAK